MSEEKRLLLKQERRLKRKREKALQRIKKAKTKFLYCDVCKVVKLEVDKYIVKVICDKCFMFDPFGVERSRTGKSTKRMTRAKAYLNHDLAPKNQSEEIGGMKKSKRLIEKQIRKENERGQKRLERIKLGIETKERRKKEKAWKKIQKKFRRKIRKKYKVLTKAKKYVNLKFKKRIKRIKVRLGV